MFSTMSMVGPWAAVYFVAFRCIITDFFVNILLSIVLQLYEPATEWGGELKAGQQTSASSGRALLGGQGGRVRRTFENFSDDMNTSVHALVIDQLHLRLTEKEIAKIAIGKLASS